VVSVHAVLRRDLAATCRFLRFTFPDKLIIFRNTAPGHPHCLPYKEPLPQSQDLSKKAGTWGLFQGENVRAKSIVESFGIVYLDVNAQKQFRADGHRGTTGRGKWTACTTAFHRLLIRGFSSSTTHLCSSRFELPCHPGSLLPMSSVKRLGPVFLPSSVRGSYSGLASILCSLYSASI